ncbi:PEST proteolytic signal-containing nuclear protein-like [Marmota monax]|uniref:PEST proteolytic signal-containing nuclear protein-like n=1 Tax=Marmota monax TaxID=9995 RepID=UPI0026E95805|nr:PEST proteolytic signal-containing nuclear protein-like [Marmota monax]
MADGKAGEEKPEKPQRVAAARVMEGKVPVAALRSDRLKKKLQTSQQSLQRSPIAAAFNEDEDSEPEEMPPGAKMRMKNTGRDTPTSAGPNSFNKGKQRFSDNQKPWE